MASKRRGNGGKGERARTSPTNDKLEGLETFREDGADELLTTNQGVRINDNQNSLKAGARGPSLLEDFILREKITHFDHERIPERVVHARGAGAHGHLSGLRVAGPATPRPAFLQDPAVKTPVFVRFSTVAGLARLDRPRARRARLRRQVLHARKATSTSSATTSRSSSSRTR